MSYKKIISIIILISIGISLTMECGKSGSEGSKTKSIASLRMEKTLFKRGNGLSISLAPDYVPQPVDVKIIQQLFNDALKNPEKIAETNHAYFDEYHHEIDDTIEKIFNKNIENIIQKIRNLIATQQLITHHNDIQHTLDTIIEQINTTILQLKTENKITYQQESFEISIGWIKHLKTIVTYFINAQLTDTDILKQLDEIKNNILHFPENGIITVISPAQLTSMKTHTLTNPLWSLAECDDCDDFDRIVNQKKIFIDQQTRSYALLHPDKTKPLYYTSIGSGEGLVDFVTLNHLVQEGYNHIEVRFIDLDYEPLIKKYKNINFTNFEMTQIYYAMEQILTWFNIYLKQLLKRDITVTISLYGSTDAYKKDYSKQNKMLKNNIFYAVDIGLDWVINEKSGANDIEWLINNTLVDGGWAFLFKDNDYIVEKTDNHFIIEGFKTMIHINTSKKQKLETWIDPTSPVAPIQSLGKWTVNTFNINDLINKQFTQSTTAPLDIISSSAGGESEESEEFD